MCFTRSCQSHLELESARGLSSFYLGHFFSSKSFNHIAKDASILHLKSNDSHRLNYFSSSTPSWHTSHHHDQPIACYQFLNGEIWLTYHRRLVLDMERFWHLFWTNLTSCNFSLFLFLTPLYILKIYSVFINKVLQGFKMVFSLKLC
jgi:hypothetical protein